MKDILIVHPDLMRKGGAESVCLHTIDALLPEYDIDLLTFVDPEFEELNTYYDLCLEKSDISVKIPKFGNIGWLGVRGGLLRNSILKRVAKKAGEEYDLVVSTSNEMTIGHNSVQYIHFPMYSRDVIPNAPGTSSPIYSVYDYVCRTISGFEIAQLKGSGIVTNSNWTANLIKKAYAIRPSVISPPVDTDFPDKLPWHQREDGFVTIGRIEPSKNIIQLIDVIRELRDSGYSFHYHIIGPIDDMQYYKKINRKISDIDYIIYEGEVSRRKLKNILINHKYGLHGKKYEHFGIVVAEMVEAGMIPFVPSSGGQSEIVNKHPHLTFGTIQELTTQIKRLVKKDLSDEAIRKILPTKNQYSKKLFKQEMAKMVTNHVY